MDALKRVTDKLRGENDRLRRVAGDGGGRAEAERTAREAKKKAVSCVCAAAHLERIVVMGTIFWLSYSSPLRLIGRLFSLFSGRSLKGAPTF